MLEIQAPNDISKTQGPTVFLAGTIDMGEGEEWQKKLMNELADYRVTFLNPRRDDFKVWEKQSIDNAYFAEQVNWELEGLEQAELVVIYLAPGSKSPISLLELGLCASKRRGKLVVCCPEGFYRKGNVDIVCEKYGIDQVNSLDLLISYIRTPLRKK